MKTLLPVILVLALLMPLAVLAPLACAQTGKQAPNFSLQTGSGSTVELAKLKGKVVVVNFWATWCGPCRVEIPGFVSVYEKYKNKGLEIVGISLDQKGWSALRPFIERNKITYPVVLDNGEVASRYGDIRSIPTTFIVDRKGNIVDTHIGSMDAISFEKLVKKYI
jgi:cytochrome c biogenesis protein CcmG/thiol:disulfide interchange protein DsbE